MIRFALHTYGNFFANYVARNLDNLLVGWCYGSVSLGYYKRAYDLFALPVNQLTSPLTNVALAGLSRLRGDPDKYRKYYLKCILLVAFVGMGLSAMLTLTGKDLVRLVLGPKWEHAGSVFTCFAPGTGILLIYSTIGWLHLSLGRADRWFGWGVFEMVVTGLLFLIGLPFGPRGVAIAWTCSLCILASLGFSYAGRPIRLSFLSISSAVWRYALSAIVAGVVCWSLFHWIEPTVSFLSSVRPYVRVMVLGSLFGILYLSVLLIFPFPTTLGPIIDICKSLRPRSTT